MDRFIGSSPEEAPAWETAPDPITQPLYDVVEPQASPPTADQPLYPTATPPAPPPPPQYVFPPIRLLKMGRGSSGMDVSEELKHNAQTLVDTLKSFGVQTRITDICRGPAVTRYELQPSAGVKISKITGLADDIALNLASAGIRIEAPIPNKAAVGIEVPNKNISVVTIREIIESQEFQPARRAHRLPGRILFKALPCRYRQDAPRSHCRLHCSGKSVCINSIIMSLLYKYSRGGQLLMVDPKVGWEFTTHPHLLVRWSPTPKRQRSS